MDRPIASAAGARRWPVWLAVGLAALVVVVLLARPLIRRWALAETSFEAERLRFATVTRGDLVHDIGVQGRVVAASSPTLYSPARGLVTLRVREGQLVAEEEVLAEVASPELESRVRQERAILDALGSDLGRQELAARQQNLANGQRVELLAVEKVAAGRSFERSRRLFELGLVNQIDLEQSRDQVTIAELELEQARQRLALEEEALALEREDKRARVERQRELLADLERQVGELTIRSPVDGQVGNLEITERDAVIQGQPLLTVVDLTELEVEVSIPETAAGDISPGAEAVVTLDGRDWKGRLTRVAAEVRDAQVVGRVAFVGRAPANLRQNQRVSTRLVLARRENVIKVPRGPFLEAGGGRQVYVVADGLARRRHVITGAVSVTEVEIADGLAEGERIVLSDTGVFRGVETVLLRE